MRSCWRHGKEWPPLEIISEENTNDITRPVFEKLGFFGQKEKFEIPIDLANMVPGFLAIHIIFFRHHQYIARSLHNKYPNWSDDRLFETSKMINILSCLRVTALDYINSGINTAMVKIRIDQNTIENLLTSKIYRLLNVKFLPIYSPSIEFNLLYRFHQLIPDSIKMIKNYSPNDPNFKNINSLNLNQNNGETKDKGKNKGKGGAKLIRLPMPKGVICRGKNPVKIVGAFF